MLVELGLERYHVPRLAEAVTIPQATRGTNSAVPLTSCSRAKGTRSPPISSRRTIAAKVMIAKATRGSFGVDFGEEAVGGVIKRPIATCTTATQSLSVILHVQRREMRRLVSSPRGNASMFGTVREIQNGTWNCVAEIARKERATLAPKAALTRRERNTRDSDDASARTRRTLSDRRESVSESNTPCSGFRTRLTEHLNVQARLEPSELARQPHKGVRESAQHGGSDESSGNRSRELDMIVLGCELESGGAENVKGAVPGSPARGHRVTRLGTTSLEPHAA